MFSSTLTVYQRTQQATQIVPFWGGKIHSTKATSIIFSWPRFIYSRVKHVHTSYMYILYHTAGQGTFTPSYCTCTHYVICQSINTSSYVIWYSNYWCMYMCSFAQCVVRYVCCDNDLHNVCIRVCIDVCVGMSLGFSVLKWHRFFHLFSSKRPLSGTSGVTGPSHKQSKKTKGGFGDFSGWWNHQSTYFPSLPFPSLLSPLN